MNRVTFTRLLKMSLASKLLLDVKYPKVFLASLALLLISLGSWCYFNYSYILLFGLKDELQLTNSTLHMQNWWRTNETSFLRISLYDYSSEEDKHLQGHLRGPYVFQLTHERTPVDLNDHLIRYKQFDHLTFLSDESRGLTLQDAIVTVSVSSIHAKNLLLRSNLTQKLRHELQSALNDTGQFTYKNTTIQELLLDGRRSKLMSIINNNDGHLPGLLPYRYIGESHYSINSGKKDAKLIASLESIDGEPIALAQVRDGHQFTSGVRKTQFFPWLEPSWCIFGHLLYNKSRVKERHTIYDFTLRSYESDERWPASHLKRCRKSLPLVHKVNPYSSHFEIEPISGIVIESTVTFDLVAVLEEHESSSGNCVGKEVPLIQVAKVSQVSKDIEEEVTNEITRSAWLFKSTSICIVAGGLICLLASCFVFYRQQKVKKNAESRANEDFQLMLSQFDDL